MFILPLTDLVASEAITSVNYRVCQKSFPRFPEYSGDMFRRTDETNIAAEHFSGPFSEPGKNSFGGPCTCT